MALLDEVLPEGLRVSREHLNPKGTM